MNSLFLVVGVATLFLGGTMWWLGIPCHPVVSVALGLYVVSTELKARRER